MGSLKRKLCKALIGLTCVAGMMSSSFAADENANATNLSADPAFYMRNIVPVYFPPVPFGWKVVVADNAVNFTKETPGKVTQETSIKMRYTRKTYRMDAEQYMDRYVATHSCENKVKEGTGFYTAACLTNNTYAIVIGEVNNMYIIELTGEFNQAARAILEQYVSSIIRGKKVFADRNIGDLSTKNVNP